MVVKTNLEVKKMDKEYEWLMQHPEEEAKYRGECIVVVGSNIVVHGKDSKKVLEEAKKYSDKPLIAYVPEEEVLIF